jgi:hypothetical protein
MIRLISPGTPAFASYHNYRQGFAESLLCKGPKNIHQKSQHFIYFGPLNFFICDIDSKKDAGIYLHLRL